MKATNATKKTKELNKTKEPNKTKELNKTKAMMDETKATTYVGNRGYTVYKNSVSEIDKENIRKELLVKPYIPKSIITQTPFPVYRESSQKMYLPRFYGTHRYGVPDKIEIPEGDNINANFKGGLRDYQVNIVNKFIGHIKDNNNIGGGLLEVDTGMGKTICALNIISVLKKKTLIVVHKEFLMDQWIERINEFLPGTSVGKIQGKTMDIEGKDICIAMLQSLSMKDYDLTQFASFGFTIIDEVHHMGAEVFSQALLKVVTYYVLGLSATMERKDGLTKVFKMFIGDIIHTEKRDTSKAQVLVKALDFEIDDDEFNTIKYDYRGNPQYSTMIGKLCSCNRRSDFIIKILKKILEENENQQVMILAHNKSILTYLYDAINHHQIADVGYYVGGMKKEKLKESESKKIIIGTYAMASEGLDIKTLTTLIMATPKSDIVQTVGRILRCEDAKPLVIDIVDKHDMFQRQFLLRKRFYKKQKYTIMRSSNSKFDNNEWVTVYDPAKKDIKKTAPKNDCLFEFIE